MAVVNTKANLISKRDAGAIVAGHLSGASLRQGVATVETLANDSANSVYRFMRVHSSWTIGSIEAFNDALTGGTSYSAGLYDTAERGGAVVSVGLFGTGIDLSTAHTTPLEVTFKSLDIANIEKRIWELLGLANDPGRDYDLALTAVTPGTAAGTISLRVRWTQEV